MVIRKARHDAKTTTGANYGQRRFGRKVSGPSDLLTPEEFEAAIRAVGAERYHDKHIFHKMLHGGQMNKGQVQAWALNRYCYQDAVPRKDAALMAMAVDAQAWTWPLFILAAMQHFVENVLVVIALGAHGADGGFEFFRRQKIARSRSPFRPQRRCPSFCSRCCSSRYVAPSELPFPGASIT